MEMGNRDAGSVDVEDPRFKTFRATLRADMAVDRAMDQFHRQANAKVEGAKYLLDALTALLDRTDTWNNSKFP